MSSSPVDNIEASQVNRVVCVMTHLRAGSGFMSSLLDSHPNLLSTPDDILMGFYEFWDQYGELPADRLVTAFLDHYAVLFDAWGVCKCPRVGMRVGDLLNWTTLGPDRDEKLEVDQETFKRVMAELIGTEGQVDRKLFFQALHVAYAKALGWQIKDPQILFGLHIPHPRVMREFFNDFPDGKLLQMIRHPISALGSHFRHYLNSGHVHPTAVPTMVSRAVYGPPIPLDTHSQWRGVRLEDVHKNPKETMQRICEWLEIPWDDTLVQSTVNGKQWWNEKGRPQLTGPNQAIISQSNEDLIPAFDRFRLNVLSARRCEADGYDVKSRYQWIVTKLLLLPFLIIPLKMELMGMFAVPWNIDDEPDPLIIRKSPSIVSRVPKAIHGLYLGRRVMLGAWLRLFAKPTNRLDMI